jgi:translation initiation factor RLI1
MPVVDEQQHLAVLVLDLLDTREPGKPRIIEETCTGCGVCQHVCPAPANAILLMPVQERPLPNAKTQAEGESTRKTDHGT